MKLVIQHIEKEKKHCLLKQQTYWYSYFRASRCHFFHNYRYVECDDGVDSLVCDKMLSVICIFIYFTKWHVNFIWVYKSFNFQLFNIIDLGTFCVIFRIGDIILYITYVKRCNIGNHTCTVPQFVLLR